MNSFLASDLSFFTPFISLSTAIALLISGHLARWSSTLLLILVGVIIACAWSMGLYYSPVGFKVWGISFDAIGAMSTQILLPLVFIVAALSIDKTDYNRKIGSLLLVFLSGIGALAVLLSHNWMVLFVAIQCMSIPIYALIAKDTNNPEAIKASMHYLILSAVSMAFMLFGILLFYAATGSFDFYEQALFLQNTGFASPLLMFGLVLITISFSFKLSLAPFHFWTPEIYQAAPFSVVGLMVLIAKSVLIFLLARIFLVFGSKISDSLSTFFLVFAIASMYVGQGLMLIERRTIRFFAYFSIAHMGFLIPALVVRSQLGIEALFLDLIGFSLAFLLILVSLMSLDKKWSKSFTIDEFRGLLYTHPWHASALTLAFLSLIGFPLTAGFVGKYAVFMSVIEAGYWSVVAHMAILSLLGLIAFSKIIMIFCDTTLIGQQRISSKLPILLVAFMFALIFFGVFPEVIIAWVKSEAYLLNS